MARVSAEKNREYQARWYAKNKDTQHRRARERNQNLRKWIQGLKAERGCSRCDENHPAALDFAHRGDDKVIWISVAVRNGWGKKRILAEIAKCDILCANCHRKAHWAVAQQ